MIKIITDTTAGLPPELTRERGIPVLPQIVIFGDEQYRDDTELDTPTFLAKLRSSAVLPKTAAPPPALYNPIYKEYLAEGHTVLVIAPTSELSGTYRSAMVAAGDFPGADIHVFDTRSIAGPLAAMVLVADDWAKAGLDLPTILARLADLRDRQHFYLLVATLDCLYKGGRIGGAAHLFGSILQVKPILKLADGRIDAFEQQRTHSRAVSRLREITLRNCPPGPESYLNVMHIDTPEEAQLLADCFAEQFGLPSVPIYRVPPAAVVHSGPGALAVAFFGKDAGKTEG
jgi:DegV family protein with EDD domain